MITVYGISNCDTVKKARGWLDGHQIDYTFHDFRTDGLTATQVRKWLTELGWETLINKRSTSWKALDDNTKNTLDNRSAVAVILESPTLIKRPLLDTGTVRRVGFSAGDYESLLLGG